MNTTEQIQNFIRDTKNLAVTTEEWRTGFLMLSESIDDYFQAMHHLENELLKEFGAEKVKELYNNALSHMSEKEKANLTEEEEAIIDDVLDLE